MLTNIIIMVTRSQDQYSNSLLVISAGVMLGFHTCAVPWGGRLFPWEDSLCGMLGMASRRHACSPARCLSWQTRPCCMWHLGPGSLRTMAGSMGYRDGPFLALSLKTCQVSVGCKLPTGTHKSMDNVRF